MIVPITPRDSYPLSPLEERVKELLDKGTPHWQIMKKLHISQDYFRDCVYEIRKQEAIMAQKLTNEQRVEIYRRWKEDGTSQAELAEQFRVSAATVSLIIKKMNSVPEMLDALSAADDKPVTEDALLPEDTSEQPENMPMPEPVVQEIEQVAAPVTMTVEHTAEIPDVVVAAVHDKINNLKMQLDLNNERMECLQDQSKAIKAVLAELEQWLKEVQHDSTENHRHRAGH